MTTFTACRLLRLNWLAMVDFPEEPFGDLNSQITPSITTSGFFRPSISVRSRNTMSAPNLANLTAGANS